MPSNSIAGITLDIDLEKGVYICYIEDFSEELKGEIRKMLNNIWHGAVDVEENNEIYSYKVTIKRFLERYNSKSPNTKKGMMGELLAHLLIPKYISDFEAISIMKNKEEKSIRKGFDIVYCKDKSSLWYCEVKSGGDTNSTEDIDQKNKQLLTAAKTGITSQALGDRAELWDSVLLDVKSTIFDSNRQLRIKELLREDHPDIEDRSMDRNIVLSSVLYKVVDNKICQSHVSNYKDIIDEENLFAGVIIFSIQKSTYRKIEEFLIDESNR